MAVSTRRRIDKALASARKDLESQLGVVRAEMARLASEEKELTATLATLTPGGGSSSPTPVVGARPAGKASARKRTARSANGRRARGRRTASKSTAERVEELRALLAEGPKSRNDLAAGLKVSPARVQQLLGELGASVSSEPASDRRGKLWSINGAPAAKPKRGGRQAKRG